MNTPESSHATPQTSPHQFSRREALAAGAGALAAGLAGGMMPPHAFADPKMVRMPDTNPALTTDMETLATVESTATVPATDQTPSDIVAIQYDIHGDDGHQPGILTPAQQTLQLAAFNLLVETSEDLKSLMLSWTRVATALMAGEPYGNAGERPDIMPPDTGEAFDLGPAGLTITFGFGRSLFEDEQGNDRFGLKAYCPENLIAEMRAVEADALDPELCGGDICIQVCSEDPTVTAHAMHMMVKIAYGRAYMKWVQTGYSRTISPAHTATPRNPFGFKDGTQASQLAEQPDKLRENVWIAPEDPAGELFAGGTFLCFRRIRLLMEEWDGLTLREQEDIFGRTKLEGGPLSGGGEFDEVDYEATDENGELLVPELSHQYAVAAETNDGRTMLRRSYSFIEGRDDEYRIAAGLAFIAFVRDPETNFVDIMARMDGTTLLEFMRYEGSAVFLCPPALQPDETMIAQSLFDKI